MPVIINPNMDSMGDLLLKKAKQIDFDEKREEICLAQAELMRFMAEGAKVVKVDQATVSINTRSSAVAGELRFLQVKLLGALSKALERDISRLYIRTS